MWDLQTVLQTLERITAYSYAKNGIRRPAEIVTTTQLADWRRRMVQLLNTIDSPDPRPDAEGVGSRIGRLSRAGSVPREIAAFMRTVTEMRNVAEYQSKVLSIAESKAVAAAYEAIREWADANGLLLDT